MEEIKVMLIHTTLHVDDLIHKLDFDNIHNLHTAGCDIYWSLNKDFKTVETLEVKGIILDDMTKITNNLQVLCSALVLLQQGHKYNLN